MNDNKAPISDDTTTTNDNTNLVDNTTASDSVPTVDITTTTITKEQLNSIGIDLPDDEMAALIEHTESAINERIGEEIIDSLDDDQLKEFVGMQDRNTPAEQIEQWIIERVDDYQEIIEDNVAIVLGELAESVESIQSA